MHKKAVLALVSIITGKFSNLLTDELETTSHLNFPLDPNENLWDGLRGDNTELAEQVNTVLEPTGLVMWMAGDNTMVAAQRHLIHSD